MNQKEFWPNWKIAWTFVFHYSRQLCCYIEKSFQGIVAPLGATKGAGENPMRARSTNRIFIAQSDLYTQFSMVSKEDSSSLRFSRPSKPPFRHRPWMSPSIMLKPHPRQR